MVVKLLINQISTFWEAIKFCTVKADEVDEENIQFYLNDLLHKLLSDRAQCFVRLDDDRVFISLIITKIYYDKITGKKSLHIQCLYSFSKVDEAEWNRDLNLIKKFARSVECPSVTFDTRNRKVMELGTLLGFKEVKRSFALEVYDG